MQNSSGKRITATLCLLLVAFLGTGLETVADEDVIEVEPAKLTPAKKAAMDWVDSNEAPLASWSESLA